jgi:Outer membrane protein beta-barrel family
MKIILSFLSLLIVIQMQAQQGFTVKGTTVLANGKSLNELPVQLYFFNGEDTFYTNTNSKGNFTFKNVNKTSFYINISLAEFKPFIKFYDLQIENNEVKLDTIVLMPLANNLQGISVIGKQAILIKEDTLSFNADSFKTKGDLPTEELLKKLPGVMVDNDGNITAQGKQVTGVKVNGKEFFGGDVKAATKEIPVEMIDKIQIIDDYGDQSNFTGNKDGEATKIINLLLRKDKNEGYFGNATVGVGTNQRYIVGGSLNSFKNTKQISLTVNANNINRENFSTSMPGTGRSGGGGRGTEGGGFNAMGRSTVGDASSANQNNSTGITNLWNFGFNYRNDINKKLSHYGSYVYTFKNTQTISETLQQIYFEENNNSNLQNIIDTNKGNNHRLNYNIEYKLDTNNFIKISPQFSFRQSNNHNANAFNIIDAINNATTNGLQDFVNSAASPYIGNTLLWNHKFKKNGRSASISTTTNYNQTSQDDSFTNKSIAYVNATDTINANNAQQIDINNYTKTFGANISFIEPFTSRHSLEFSYNYNTSVINNDRQTAVRNNVTQLYTISDSLSNEFENIYNTHKIGSNWRFIEKMYNVSIGFAVQPASITTKNFTNDYQLTQSVFNYFPTARFVYKFTKNKNIEVTYNGRTNQPSILQLQPVIDRSNRQFITIGNPLLLPEFTNTFRIRYTNFVPKTGVSITANMRFEFVKDKITSNTKSIGQGMLETQYLNADNNNSTVLFYNIAKPFRNRKYTIKLNGHTFYNNTFALANSKENFGRKIYVYQTLMLDINAAEWITLNAGINYIGNDNKYSLNPAGNTSTSTYSFSSEATFFIPYHFRINYSFNKLINSGFANNVNANPFIINGYIEKQFLKGNRGSVRISVYDLLNQNTNITRTVNANTITDAQDNRLMQYFLLSASYKLSKFTGNQPEQPQGERPWHGGGR